MEEYEKVEHLENTGPLIALIQLSLIIIYEICWALPFYKGSQAVSASANPLNKDPGRVLLCFPKGFCVNG